MRNKSNFTTINGHTSQNTFAKMHDFCINSQAYLSDLKRKCRSSRKLVLLVVFIALLFDNMLLTTIGNLLKYKSLLINPFLEFSFMF
jgi:hypothetical protein